MHAKGFHSGDERKELSEKEEGPMPSPTHALHFCVTSCLFPVFSARPGCLSSIAPLLERWKILLSVRLSHACFAATVWGRYLNASIRIGPATVLEVEIMRLARLCNRRTVETVRPERRLQAADE